MKMEKYKKICVASFQITYNFKLRINNTYLYIIEFDWI